MVTDTVRVTYAQPPSDRGRIGTLPYLLGDCLTRSTGTYKEALTIDIRHVLPLHGESLDQNLQVSPSIGLLLLSERAAPFGVPGQELFGGQYIGRL